MAASDRNVFRLAQTEVDVRPIQISKIQKSQCDDMFLKTRGGSIL